MAIFLTKIDKILILAVLIAPLYVNGCASLGLELLLLKEKNPKIILGFILTNYIYEDTFRRIK